MIPFHYICWVVNILDRITTVKKMDDTILYDTILYDTAYYRNRLMILLDIKYTLTIEVHATDLDINPSLIAHDKLFETSLERMKNIMLDIYRRWHKFLKMLIANSDVVGEGSHIM